MKEICSAIKGWAKENGVELPKGWRKEVKKIFDHVDADKSGDVTLDEIHAAIWKAVDGNNDGYWSLEEVTAAIKALAKEMDVKLKKGWKKEVKAVFKAVDKNGDGKVSP